ncbi:DDB1- and CUL4-associated factor 12 [Dinochytrium kinnereticum]|nr:DDB1- and CUL4-associated factor 12 [Dinochytrium kinnereticum]
MGAIQDCSIRKAVTASTTSTRSANAPYPIHHYLQAREIIPRGISRSQRFIRSAPAPTLLRQQHPSPIDEKRATSNNYIAVYDSPSSLNRMQDLSDALPHQFPVAAEGKDVDDPTVIIPSVMASERVEWSSVVRSVDSRKVDADALTAMRNITARRLPMIVKERQFDVSGLDKIFASMWLNESEIVLGTKCNRLIVLNVHTSKKFEIPSIVGHRSSSGWSYGSVPAAALSLVGAGNPFQAASSRSPFIRATVPLASGFPSTQTPPPRRDSENFQCCGIHSLAINPSKTMLAVGSGHPTEFIQIYSLPTFEPLAILSGHSDMVFSVGWVSDNVLVSGSRDTTVKLWSLTDEHLQSNVRTVNGSKVSIFGPLLSKKEHCGKVRDLKYNHATMQATSLSTDGTVKIFDASRLSVAASIPLVHTQETVCLGMGIKENIYSVGSQSHISLIDPRVGSIVHTIESCDEGWGVRSMTINDGVITIGGGYGRISFYDLRAQGYLSWRSRASNILNPLDAPQTRCLQNSGGWLDKDEFYTNHFLGQDIRNAVYTLSYDPYGVRLFSAGGPLQLNLCGSYAGLWD